MFIASRSFILQKAPNLFVFPYQGVLMLTFSTLRDISFAVSEYRLLLQQLLGYVHYKKGHLKAELTWNATFRDNSHTLCDFLKNSRCSEKDSDIREQIPELRVLSTFIPKAEVRYLKNFSPAAIWQLFSYDIDNVSFLSVFVICRSI